MSLSIFREAEYPPPNLDITKHSDIIRFFEDDCKACETSYAKDPRDAQNLRRWGASLYELSKYRNVDECKQMLQDAISKLEEAVAIDPKNDGALYIVGSVYTTITKMTPDPDEAEVSFDKAVVYFRRAYNVDPNRKLYRKSMKEISSEVTRRKLCHKSSMEMSSKAPAFAAEKQIGPATAKNLKYSMLGWAILVVGLVTWVGFAKSKVPPLPLPK